ncbi:MAG: recombinase family protein [Spirulinaceae cyanobacterium]
MPRQLKKWIIGLTRSGKTTQLVREFRQWVTVKLSKRQFLGQLSPAILVFAANDDNRRELADQLAIAIQGSYPVISKTPLGFISDEVMLFWPLLFELLDLKAQFPLRLRPETEQELATQLWRKSWQQGDLQLSGVMESRLVRQTLDLLQLAGASGTETEAIADILALGLPEQEWENSVITIKGKDIPLWQHMATLLLEWRQWSLTRGLLSYGVIYELYWRYLLPNPTYQQHLTSRYQAIFADDVDDYPAIAGDLLQFLLDQGATGVFTYNPQGGIRLGLNADPQYLGNLAAYCQIEDLTTTPLRGLGGDWHETIVQMVKGELFIPRVPPTVQSIQATSRATLLRETANAIIQGIKQGEVKASEIALIAPGLDEIARYSLIEMLTSQGIAVEALNEQRPLISFPLIRALLTLLTLIYPHLGRLVDKDAVAEMLVVLSRTQQGEGQLIAAIDPVRAGLLADHCYLPDPRQPHLLAIESFPRWDRLGHQASQAYQNIAQWIETKKSSPDQPLPRVIDILDAASKHFLQNAPNLPYNQLAALRELMETAQHYWQVERRLRDNETRDKSYPAAIAQFIQLLRRGTITANAYPLRPLKALKQEAITLATIFQYRSSRRSHRWHFWLDASSSLWSKGGAANLFASHLFLRNWERRPLTPQENAQLEEERLVNILKDLLGRVDERLILCHSDLAVNGKEQNGPLLGLVHASGSIQ